MEHVTVEQARELLMEEDVLTDSAAEGAGSKSAAESDGPKAIADGALDAAGADVPADESGLDEGQSEKQDEEARTYADGTVGLGVDIVEIERMRGILERRPSFAEQVFSPAERAYCDSKASPATHYALRFAAKEAVVKALGTGFSEGIWVHDIEVERASNGKPLAKLSGRALEVAQAQGVRELSLSLSYTHTDAVACALAVTESSVQATEARKDPMEELARQFKETRKILDDL